MSPLTPEIGGVVGQRFTDGSAATAAGPLRFPQLSSGRRKFSIKLASDTGVRLPVVGFQRKNCSSPFFLSR